MIINNVISPFQRRACLSALSITWPPHWSHDTPLNSDPVSPPSSASTSATWAGLANESSRSRATLPVISVETSAAWPLTSDSTFSTNRAGETHDTQTQSRSLLSSQEQKHALQQGSPDTVLEGRCPAEFSSSPNQTHLKQLIKVLLGILETSREVCWGKLELNSTGHRPSRIKFGDPCFTDRYIYTHTSC